MAIDVVTIRDPHSGSDASIAPGLGFNCFSFKAAVNGRLVESLWQDPHFLEGTTRHSRSGIPILFPFAGRIRGARFRYQEQFYDLTPSDEFGNAIHGFVLHRPWRVIEQSATRVVGEFQASRDDAAILPHWPTDFRIRATYEVCGAELLCTYEFHNPSSTTLPWSFGTHPYFRLSLGEGPSSEATVRFNVRQRWKLNQLIPTGERESVAESAAYAAGVTIGDRQFDDVFTDLAFTAGYWRGEVIDRASGLQTTVRHGVECQQCVVFIPPHREAICLEPYTAVPNAFELAEQGIATGLQELAPGDTKSIQISITTSGLDP